MKKKGKYICNRCGKIIDTKTDLDCIEAKAFMYKSITEIKPEKEFRSITNKEFDDTKFSRMGTYTKYHFCGECYDMLIKYTYGFEYDTVISDEIIRCRDCKKYGRDCPLQYHGRNDFYCGYAESKHGKTN